MCGCMDGHIVLVYNILIHSYDLRVVTNRYLMNLSMSLTVPITHNFIKVIFISFLLASTVDTKGVNDSVYNVQV